MLRRFLVATCALGCTLATAPRAAAQTFPISVLPPLPIPPLPPPDFRIAPDRPHPATPPDTTTAIAQTNLAITMRPTSGAEIRALWQSQAHEDWYGWQTLTVDATATGVLLFGAAFVTSRPPALTQDPRPLPLSVEGGALGVYAVGPSVVHFAHGSIWKGLGSVALRALLPLAGFATGYVAGGAYGETGARQDGTVGGILGCVGAVAIDAAWLGWDRWSSVGASRPPAASFARNQTERTGD